ncbi:anti-sigma-I factor RsgI family protein [Desulfosporosinus fructosivorans]
MSKMKAVVLEKSGSRYTVLGQDGTFRHVHRRLNAEVGEEIQIQQWNDYFSGIRIWAGAVAVFVLVLTALLGWNLYQAPTAVALLSVDINPSLQFVLDKQGNLLKFETQNEDAKRMLSQIDLKGKPIEEVLEQIIIQAYDEKFLSSQQPWVMIGYSPMNNKTIEQMPKELNEGQISSWVTEISKKKGLTPQVAVFSLNSQERELAQKGELTLGEYALWQTADKAGIVTQPEKLKDTSERVRLLENPQVQAQIKTEKTESKVVLPKASGTGKQDSGAIGKLGEDGTPKLLPGGKFFSPFKVLGPRIDKSRSSVTDKQKDQDNVKNEQKNQDNNRDKQRDQDNVKNEQKNQDNDRDKQKNQETTKVEDKQKAKDQDKVKNRENEETSRMKYDRIYTPENLKPNTSRTYKFPDFDWNKQQRR